MPLFKRPDGTLAKDLPAYRRMMPYILKTRTESTVYYEQDIDVGRTQAFVDRYNATHPRRITIFHVYLWAAARALNERPGMNRFVAGGRVYQRDGVWLSFSAKKEMADGSPVVVLKRRFEPGLSFEDFVAFVHGDVKLGKSDHKGHQEKEVAFSLALPSILLRIGLWAIRLLDSWNLLPGAYIKPDPMYASMFVVNLGSLKLEAAYHHLYEYGNIPLFATLGRVKKTPVADDAGNVSVKSLCTLRYVFDERVEDGLYCAKSLELLRGYLEDPEAHGATLSAPAPAPAQA